MYDMMNTTQYAVITEQNPCSELYFDEDGTDCINGFDFFLLDPGVDSELHPGNSLVHGPSLHGCKDVRASGELSDNPEHAPAPDLHQARPLGHGADSNDQVRPRVCSFCHPAGTQSPRLDELQEADGHSRHRRLGAAAAYTGAGTLCALLRLLPQPHGVPREHLHLCHPALCLLYQDMLAPDIEGLNSPQCDAYCFRGGAWSLWDGFVLEVAPPETLRGLTQPEERTLRIKF